MLPVSTYRLSGDTRDTPRLRAATRAKKLISPPVETPVGGVPIYSRDHFLVAWYNTGSPRAIRYVLRNPRAALVDQAAIFEPHEISKLDRLLSHHLIGGPLVAGLWFVAPDIALLTAATLYVHVVADLVADIRDLADSDESLR